MFRKIALFLGLVEPNGTELKARYEKARDEFLGPAEYHKG